MTAAQGAKVVVERAHGTQADATICLARRYTTVGGSHCLRLRKSPNALRRTQCLFVLAELGLIFSDDVGRDPAPPANHQRQHKG